MSNLTIEGGFSIGDKVWIDDDPTLVGTVTALLVRASGTFCEVSYVYDGDARCPMVETYRLTRKTSP